MHGNDFGTISNEIHACTHTCEEMIAGCGDGWRLVGWLYWGKDANERTPNDIMSNMINDEHKTKIKKSKKTGRVHATGFDSDVGACSAVEYRAPALRYASG